MKKRVLTAALCLTLLVGMMPARAATSFPDVPAKHWAYRYVTACAERGAVEGAQSGKFLPNEKVTTGAFLAVLTRLLTPGWIPEKTEKGSHWAERYRIAAVNSGLLPSRVPAGLVDMDHVMTREEMAWTLAQAALYRGMTLTRADQSAVSDLGSVDGYYTESVLQCYGSGFITGTGDGKFAPQEQMSRAEMATVICRLMGYAV